MARKKKQDTSTSGDSTPPTRERDDRRARRTTTVLNEEQAKDFIKGPGKSLDDAAAEIASLISSERETSLEGYPDDPEGDAAVLEAAKRIRDEGFGADMRGLGEGDDDDDEVEPEERPPESEGEEDADEGDEVQPGEGDPVHDFSDDELDLPVRMTIDGETKFVRLEDVIAGYNTSKVSTHRFMEASDMRKEATAEKEEALALRQQGQHLLTAFGEFYHTRLSPQEKAAFTESLRGAIVDSERTAEALLDARVREEEPKLLKAIPEWQNEKTCEHDVEALVRGAEKHYGMSEEFVRSLVDHRHVLALRDAVQAREGRVRFEDKLRKESRERARKANTRLLQPGARKPKGTQRSRARKQYRGAKERARRTGSIDDAAAAIMNHPAFLKGDR